MQEGRRLWHETSFVEIREDEKKKKHMLAKVALDFGGGIIQNDSCEFSPAGLRSYLAQRDAIYSTSFFFAQY